MKFFSGFCFKGERELFDEITCKSDFSVAGFSYGAQKAFEYVIACNDRVDKLQLISPAFFEDKIDKFKKVQTLHFKKDSEAYCNNFLKNITSNDFSKYFKKGSFADLQELLYYNWDNKKLEKLIERGSEIEVYLGENDKIIDSLYVKNFFQKYATIYYIKNVGHILKKEIKCQK